MLFPRVVDINRILLKMEPLVRRTLGDGTELVLALGTVPLGIKVDPAQLEIVIMNLVNNAHEAMPAEGRLTIRTGFGGGDGNGDLPVSQSGGYILADSRPGNGTAFKLFFPHVRENGRQWNDRILPDAVHTFS